MKRDDKVIGFPARLLTAALVLTGAILVATVWLAVDSYRDIATVKLRDPRIQELSGTIVHLDEVLTMSARMAAATGNPYWEQRYRRFEPQLDAAIKEAMELTAHWRITSPMHSGSVRPTCAKCIMSVRPTNGPGAVPPKAYMQIRTSGPTLSCPRIVIPNHCPHATRQASTERFESGAPQRTSNPMLSAHIHSGPA